ncbi:MAG: FG-GAP repeat protein [Planctomycetes bacterium]|nr:FG-GAP repeat protein [Planctomycetota bacterium]
MSARWWMAIVLVAGMTGAGGARGGVIWSAAVDGDVWSLALASDVNGDGLEDIAEGSADNRVRLLDAYTGEAIWFVETYGDVWALLAVDVTGDTVADIIAGTSNNEVLWIDGAEGVALGTTPTAGDVWSLAVAGDLTGDGVPEIAAGAADNQVRLLNGATRAAVWSKDLGGDVWSVAPGPDVNGDGKADIIAGTATNAVVCLSGTDGAVLWTFDIQGDGWEIVTMPDVDGDGIADIACGAGGNKVIAISGAGKHQGPLWQVKTFGDVIALCLGPDLDGDGKEDLIAGGSDDLLRAIGTEFGLEIWTFPTTGTIRAAALFGDADGDGVSDVAIGTEASIVHAVSGKDGTEIWAYPAEISVTIWSVIAGPDVDEDGVPEVMSGTAENLVTCLQGKPSILPDLITGFSCVPARGETGPEAVLEWIEGPNTESVQIHETTGGAWILLAEIPAGVQAARVELSGEAAERTLVAAAIIDGHEGDAAACAVTLLPPEVGDLSCVSPAPLQAALSWTPPTFEGSSIDTIEVLEGGERLALALGDGTGVLLQDLAPGPHTFDVIATWFTFDSAPASCTVEVEPQDPIDVRFIRGEVNGDGRMDIGDPVAILNYLFSDGAAPPCIAAADVNADGMVDIGDGVFLLSYLFAHGLEPAAPFPECGVAVTSLPCAAHPACP